MKLWRISQEENCGFDSYDSAVVAAETEQEAKLMHPDGDSVIGFPDSDPYRSWVSDSESWVSDSELVTCEYLGDAKDGTPSGVICASFNAG